MTFKAKLMICTAAFAFTASMAAAAITANDVVKSYQDAAFTYIEVKDGPTQIKVEAIKEGVKVEAVYDKDTGDVLSSESHKVAAGEAGLSGVEVKNVGGDFADQPSSDDNDDDATDDSNDDHGGSGADDDSDDDHSGSGSGGASSGGDDNSGHDAGDDHGSDSHGGHGSSHDSGDDD